MFTWCAKNYLVKTALFPLFWWWSRYLHLWTYACLICLNFQGKGVVIIFVHINNSSVIYDWIRLCCNKTKIITNGSRIVLTNEFCYFLKIMIENTIQSELYHNNSDVFWFQQKLSKSINVWSPFFKCFNTSEYCVLRSTDRKLSAKCFNWKCIMKCRPIYNKIVTKISSKDIKPWSRCSN